MLKTKQMDEIREFDTCAISDAIEQFGIRLRNEGFTRPGLRCFTQSEPRLLGYAATLRVRSSEPPFTGGAFMDRDDWWEDVAQLPIPRIVVIEDTEPTPSGSCIGEVHAAVLKALNCDGVITNGAIRDLPAVKKLGFPLFAQHVAVSHSYFHVIEHGSPVEILGLEINHGDLIYADCHGAVKIPHEIAASVADIAAQIHARETRIVQACLSPNTSREELLKMIRSEQK